MESEMSSKKAGPDLASAEEFDLDAWLDGATPPEGVVELSIKGDLAAEKALLEDKLADMRRESDGRLGGNPERLAIAKRIGELEDEMRASKRVFRFRGLSLNRVRELRALGLAEDEDEMNTRLIVECAVSPLISMQQAEQMKDKLGAGQWALLAAKAAELTFDGGVDVDFSLAASVERATAES